MQCKACSGNRICFSGSNQTESIGNSSLLINTARINICAVRQMLHMVGSIDAIYLPPPSTSFPPLPIIPLKNILGKHNAITENRFNSAIWWACVLQSYAGYCRWCESQPKNTERWLERNFPSLTCLFLPFFCCFFSFYAAGHCYAHRQRQRNDL